MTALIDTNILVYRFDPRFPQKQRIAEDLLRRGIAEDSLCLPHQAVVEFFSVVTRTMKTGEALLPFKEAYRETEELLIQFPIVYPNEHVLRTAVHGASTLQLSWFDAHMWAYAEVFGLSPLISEDFQHGRLYGGVRAFDPFQELRQAPAP